ncbi:hypothetical protein G6O67_004208 [Ophiocordyceps sinensis]|uniref:DEAD/DEAH-box helicase domain-containing protein n=1 Tax=Ophiocordyceps sinensis TaxID=72228 RepID=A0A8H4PMM4_9HYPO|nr:hypothetical protein G6O67_004208 [Ophiocordyceps sinensis]
MGEVRDDTQDDMPGSCFLDHAGNDKWASGGETYLAGRVDREPALRRRFTDGTGLREDECRRYLAAAGPGAARGARGEHHGGGDAAAGAGRGHAKAAGRPESLNKEGWRVYAEELKAKRVVDLVVVDEAHLMLDGQFRAAMADIGRNTEDLAPRRLWMTATMPPTLMRGWTKACRMQGEATVI